MDRNIWGDVRGIQDDAVATHEGGVDRNFDNRPSKGYQPESPPTRVAWIETTKCATIWTLISVATHEGGVDRNVIV